MPQQFTQLLLPLALLAFLWFFMIRPQQQRQRQRQEMLNALNAGDEVVTVGGIHGKIVAIDSETATLRIAKELDILVQRSAVGEVKRAKE